MAKIAATIMAFNLRRSDITNEIIADRLGKGLGRVVTIEPNEWSPDPDTISCHFYFRGDDGKPQLVGCRVEDDLLTIHHDWLKECWKALGWIGARRVRR